MFNKLKRLVDSVLFVSKLTSVKNKKIRILVSIILANFSVLFDILIIVIFAFLLTGEITYENKIIFYIVSFISSNTVMLPLLVVFKFLFLLLERLNLELLNLDVQKNLKSYLLKEVYELGNMSISNIYFYVNQVSAHVANFYKSFALFLNSLLQVVGYSIFLLVSESEIFSLFLISGLIILIPTRYFLKKGKFYQHKSFEENQNHYSNIQRIVENIFLIKILSSFKFEFNRLENTLEKFKNYQKLNTVFGALISVIPGFFTIFTLSIIFVSFEISNFITLEFIAILTRLFQSLGAVNTGLGLVVNSSVHVNELYKLEMNKPKLVTNSYLINKSLNNAVEINDITFTFFNTNEPIFQNLNVNIKKYTHTVITGANGSGKSTLLGLIAGLYLPEVGTVNVYSKKIGYVGVTPLVFEGTLKDNLLYGNNEIIDDELIHDYLSKFNFYNDERINLNKIISNKTLSSGQLQKVSFIRALLNKTDILLLDESTSNLDIESKKLIFDILKDYKITIINSTHNLEHFNYDVHISISVVDGSRFLSYQ